MLMTTLMAPSTKQPYVEVLLYTGLALGENMIFSGKANR